MKFRKPGLTATVNAVPLMFLMLFKKSLAIEGGTLITMVFMPMGQIPIIGVLTAQGADGSPQALKRSQDTFHA